MMNEIGKNFNLIYDTASIDGAVKYLAEHNPLPKVSYNMIYDMMMNVARKNAYSASIDKGEAEWISFTGTAGFMIMFWLDGHTKKNGYPIITAEVYVSPNFKDYTHKEEKIRDTRNV